MPFVLDRSSTSTCRSVAVRRQCTRETSAASTMKSALVARPTVLMAPGVKRKVPSSLRRIHMAGYLSTSLLRRRARLQLLEPVQHDVNLCRSWQSTLGERRSKAENPTVGRNVVWTRVRRIGNSESPRNRYRIRERQARLRPHGNRHELAGRRHVKQLRAVARPLRAPTSCDLILRASRRKRLDVGSGLTGTLFPDLVGHPPTVGRKRRVGRKHHRLDVAERRRLLFSNRERPE